MSNDLIGRIPWETSFGDQSSLGDLVDIQGKPLSTGAMSILDGVKGQQEISVYWQPKEGRGKCWFIGHGT